MNALAGVATGLLAAFLIARGRPEGVGLLTISGRVGLNTASHSFWAAVLCLPAFVCLTVIDLTGETGLPPHAAHEFALRLCIYVIDWAGFALVSHWLARLLGRGERWPVYITAWNWCNVAQYLLLVVASLPPLLGMPKIVGDTAWLVATGWALWIEWYATRLTLDITGMQAAGLVLLDEAMGFALLAILVSLQG
jgi:hypothetical protein